MLNCHSCIVYTRMLNNQAVETLPYFDIALLIFVIFLTELFFSSTDKVLEEILRNEIELNNQFLGKSTAEEGVCNTFVQERLLL